MIFTLLALAKPLTSKRKERLPIVLGRVQFHFQVGIRTVVGRGEAPATDSGVRHRKADVGLRIELQDGPVGCGCAFPGTKLDPTIGPDDRALDPEGERAISKPLRQRRTGHPIEIGVRAVMPLSWRPACYSRPIRFRSKCRWLLAQRPSLPGINLTFLLTILISSAAGLVTGSYWG